MDLLYILGYYSTACVYFSFMWGPFVHSLGIVQWNFTRRDHLGNPGRVSGSGLVNLLQTDLSMIISCWLMRSCILLKRKKREIRIYDC